MDAREVTVSGDLLALEALEAALVGARVAVVAGRVRPSARLVQSRPEDLALVAADNVARAAAAAGALQIVAVVHDAADEVERALGGHGVPLVVRREPAPANDEAIPWSRSNVVSVQRLVMPAGRDLAWVAAAYPRWIARRLGWCLRVAVEDDGTIRIGLRVVGLDLLVLTPMHAQCSSTRWPYRIAGGVLVRPGQRGTFELRRCLDEHTLLTIVHDFEPRLPWWIYRATEAPAHDWIMRAFGRSIAVPLIDTADAPHGAGDRTPRG